MTQSAFSLHSSNLLPATVDAEIGAQPCNLSNALVPEDISIEVDSLKQA
jgi:hypothetical protein